MRSTLAFAVLASTLNVGASQCIWDESKPEEEVNCVTDIPTTPFEVSDEIMEETLRFPPSDPTLLCDDFDRADGGLGSDWHDVFSGLEVVGTQAEVTRVTREDHPAAIYLPDDYLADDPWASIDVTEMSTPAGQYVGVALTLGVGGTADPIYVKVQYQDSGTFLGCYTDFNGILFGTGFTRISTDTSLFGSSFSMKVTLDPTSGATTATVSGAASGPYAGRSLTLECGTYPDYADLGTTAGMAILKGSDAGVALVDNFAHSGCAELECSRDCRRFGLPGSTMHRDALLGRCVEKCFVLDGIKERKGWTCGPC